MFTSSNGASTTVDDATCCTPSPLVGAAAADEAPSNFALPSVPHDVPLVNVNDAPASAPVMFVTKLGSPIAGKIAFAMKTNKGVAHGGLVIEKKSSRSHHY